MSKTFHINPDFHAKRIQECLHAHVHGDEQQAMTLAMMAGVDAGIMEIPLAECPLNKPGFLDLQIQWNWGHAQASKTNDNAKQQSLL